MEGVSTRKVREVTEALCGTSFSKSLVSQLAGRLDAELEAWRNRRLEAEAYPYWLNIGSGVAAYSPSPNLLSTGCVNRIV